MTDPPADPLADPAADPLADPAVLRFTLDGRPVEVPADGVSLLEVLRDRLGCRSLKDGCSPQGQCGCCTVLVDGQPRVACVTPAARVAGRQITTIDGLDPAVVGRWTESLAATGGSQCGFCTPGIVVRLAGQAASKGGTLAPDQVRQALLAHLCRCTGWQTIVEAAAQVAAVGGGGAVGTVGPERDEAVGSSDDEPAQRRARLEGRVPQRVGPDVAAGRGGFADDLAPPESLVAVRAADGGWVVAEMLAEARAAASKVPGRRTTAPITWPLEVPPGEWHRTLSTTWVEPAYLEPDASWCWPGGEPMTPLANGGAFGGKQASAVGRIARELADRHGRPVRVLWSREDVVRLGPKRPPVAAGIRSDGTGVLRVVATEGIESAVRSVAPGLEVQTVSVPGPPTSAAIRAAGWAEASVLVSSLGPGPDEVHRPDGSWARAIVADDGVHVRVRCGVPLDEVVLRSYCIGAAHMALGWVWSEGVRVDAAGEVHDLTIRSFGVLRAVDTPVVEVVIEADDGPPVNGSDAVFAAVAAAAWRALGHPPRWPTRR